MAFDINKALTIALAGLNEASNIAPAIAAGSSDHIAQASTIVDGAAQVAGQVLTDPQQQQEAVLAYAGAKSILAIFAAFRKPKG